MIWRKAVQKRWVLSRVVAPSAAGAKSRFVAVMVPGHWLAGGAGPQPEDSSSSRSRQIIHFQGSSSICAVMLTTRSADVSIAAALIQLTLTLLSPIWTPAWGSPSTLCPWNSQEELWMQSAGHSRKSSTGQSNL